MATLFAGTSIPVGSILPFGGPSTAVPDGFLLCNGAEINRNDFADLFNVIGTFWGSGDGLLTFRIPTTQGLLLRGVAYGSSFDPDRTTRTAIQTGGQTGDEVGSYQNNRFGSHDHGGGNHAHDLEYFGNGNVAFGNNARSFGMNTSSGQQYMNSSDSNAFRAGLVRASGAIIAAQGGNQTVGNNVYVNFIIKY